MTDLTQLEQRFRMANPVPDPANPPMSVSTAATALLDLDERRGTMQTQETQTPVAKPPKRQKRLVAAGLAFAVVVAAAGLALWIASSNEETSPEPAAPVEEVFLGTPTITFDGSSCIYEGPSEFTLGQPRTFKFVNAADTRFRGTSFKSAVRVVDPGKKAPGVIDGLQGGPGLGRDIAPRTEVEFSGAPGGPVPDELGTWVLACTVVWPDDGWNGVAATYQVVP